MGFIQVDEDRLEIHDDTLDDENYDCTASGVTISGIGRKRKIGAVTFTGNNNHIRCVEADSVTDNGEGNTYHPICGRGPDRMGMNPN